MASSAPEPARFRTRPDGPPLRGGRSPSGTPVPRPPAPAPPPGVWCCMAAFLKLASGVLAAASRPARSVARGAGRRPDAAALLAAAALLLLAAPVAFAGVLLWLALLKLAAR